MAWAAWAAGVPVGPLVKLPGVTPAALLYRRRCVVTDGVHAQLTKQVCIFWNAPIELGRVVVSMFENV